jgi:hypothetical protein
VSVLTLRKEDWEVRRAPLAHARALIEAWHYAKGSSLTAVYVHGLYIRGTPIMVGALQWLPPTRVAAESVNKAHWTRVLALSRMVVLPGIPRNACSYLLGAAVRDIRRDGKWVSLVTYADESQGHEGGVYRASNWTYAGRTRANPRWVSQDGRQVARQSTRTRSKAQMEALGYRQEGPFHKHKFVLHLGAARLT